MTFVMALLFGHKILDFFLFDDFFQGIWIRHVLWHGDLAYNIAKYVYMIIIMCIYMYIYCVYIYTQYIYIHSIYICILSVHSPWHSKTPRLSGQKDTPMVSVVWLANLNLDAENSIPCFTWAVRRRLTWKTWPIYGGSTLYKWCFP